MLKAEYQTRGPVPQDVIDAVPLSFDALAKDEVIMQLVGSPINPSDVLTLTGEYGILPPLPAVGGSEGIAKVIEAGEDSSLQEGSYALVPFGSGTWATHFKAKASDLTPMPNAADPLQLAMLGVNPPTASLLLSEFVDLNEGDWVIQNTANSGVGTYLIQLAKQRGLKTVNIVRREALVQPLLDMGADVVLVDNDELTAQVVTATNGAEIKLAIDAVAGGATEKLASVLTEGGTIVNYGAMSGEFPVVSPMSLIFKDITVRGFWLMRWLQAAPAQKQQALYQELAGLIAMGKLSTPIDKTFPVSQIKEAIVYANQPGRSGKVLITA